MTLREAPISPNAESFRELLTKTFAVPRYQRSYDWDDEQVGDFISDLRRLYHAERAGEPSTWHFFGALITITEPASGTIQKVLFQVVDGQQRLATLVIVLAELAKALATLRQEAAADRKTGLAKRVGRELRELRNVLEASGTPRLVLSRRDREYFESLIAGTAQQPRPHTDESHTKLWKAQQRIATDIVGYANDGDLEVGSRLDRLVDLREAVLSRSYVVHLSSDDRLEAYRLFAVLNDRGRPLSVGSLLRTHTLSVLEGFDDQLQEAEALWDEILSEGQAWVDAFLGAFYASHSGNRVTTGEMFDRFLERFSESLPSGRVTTRAAAKGVCSFARVLRDEGIFFAQLQQGDWPYPDGSAGAWDRDRLARLLTILHHSLAFPLLLAVGREADEASFTKLVLLLERFVLRYITISRGSPEALARRAYYPCASTTRKSHRFDDKQLRTELQRLGRDYAGDDVFAAGLKERLKYRVGSPAQNRLLKHFLTTLEDHYSWFAGGARGRPRATKHSVFDFKQTNLEHVYPQNPPAGQSVPAMDEAANDLGNITLLDEADGRVASSDPFSAKKSIYANSKIAITRELAEASDWSETRIAERGERYARMALKLFVV
jgi:Protein of unknown function DUF262/Protein of unknown function (DUF1524)